MLAIFKSSGEYNSNNINYQFWRQDNKPIELWSHDVIQQKSDYIHKNPGIASFVTEPEHWIYSSAIDYRDAKGLLDILYL